MRIVMLMVMAMIIMVIMMMILKMMIMSFLTMTMMTMTMTHPKRPLPCDNDDDCEDGEDVFPVIDESWAPG